MDNLTTELRGIKEQVDEGLIAEDEYRLKFLDTIIQHSQHSTEMVDALLSKIVG